MQTVGQVKPETIIKNYVEEAFRQLRIGKVEKHARHEVTFDGDVAVAVRLQGPTNLSAGYAVCVHEELGKWVVSLNGLASARVGKPAIQLTAEQLKWETSSPSE